MDITPESNRKIIVLGENTELMVQEMANAVGVGKSSVSRIVNLFQETGPVDTSLKGHCGRKTKASLLELWSNQKN